MKKTLFFVMIMVALCSCDKQKGDVVNLDVYGKIYSNNDGARYNSIQFWTKEYGRVLINEFAGHLDDDPDYPYFDTYFGSFSQEGSTVSICIDDDSQKRIATSFGDSLFFEGDMYYTSVECITQIMLPVD